MIGGYNTGNMYANIKECVLPFYNSDFGNNEDSFCDVYNMDPREASSFITGHVTLSVYSDVEMIMNE